MFIDVHSHLDLCKNIPSIIENCKEKNVKIVTYGVDKKSNRKTLELKEKYSEIGIALGVYPIDGLKMKSEEVFEEVQFILDNKDKICAIGEVGLDLHHSGEETFHEQKKVFEQFIMLAENLDLPIVVHSRKAEEETIEFLEEMDAKKVVMHCFGGGMKLVDRIVKNGWSLSIPANIKHSEHFQKIVEQVPMENLLCETDSPYLDPDKKYPNDSSKVIESYKKMGEIKEMSLEEVEKIVEGNFNKIFPSKK